MPVIEYKQDYERSNGSIIEKGTQQIVTWDRANALSNEGKAVIVGSESSRGVQDRTRAVNEMPDSAPSRPTKENTVQEIKGYLDEEDIPYSSDDIKADLLEIVNKNN